MPRALWKGHLAFGLVQIPVALYTADRRAAIEFDLLDRRDEQPIGYQKVNKTTGAPVDWKQVVKGYAITPDHYVLVEDQDFKRVAVESTHTIDITEFVPRDAIEPIYFDQPYFVGPERGGERPYRLLHAALRDSGRIGIGHVVLRAREHVAAVYPWDGLLVLNTLRYAQELRAPQDVAPEKEGKPVSRELEMAKNLIEQLEGDWKPGEHKDRYHDALLALIRRKAKSGGRGLPPPVEEPPSRATPALDLTDLLQKSLKRGRGGRDGHDRRRSNRARSSAQARPTARRKR
jgi:DNA end-binding protein Ku